MGRSVSYPSRAVVAYSHWEQGYTNMRYDEEADDWIEDEDHWEFDQDQADCDWDCIVDNFKSEVRRYYPSTSENEKWLDREDRALMANNFARFGISEYCGVIAYWVVPREDLYDSEDGLARAWVNRIADKFQERFATMHRMGGFSDGTSIYCKAA